MTMTTEALEVLHGGGADRQVVLQRAVGQKFVDLREAKGWTRKELAVALNVSWNTLGRWERGERRPPIAVLIRINEIFGVSTHEIALSAPMTAPEVMKGEAK